MIFSITLVFSGSARAEPGVEFSGGAGFGAEVTNIASGRMDFTIPEGMFCNEFPKAVLAAFGEKYKYLGARVTK
ncbi:hypothetical protein [Polyangium sp. 15x6]|uniref:hypothetical protein n=1 Tax=Polyangium sp. 15x6 TaxID=3042687 RepID=UPI00249B1CBC|nr:hypothetical protein [Polyangium sp. 15x6]MDI3282276.1 hypothetical protein [Polyangium sp. 15x6]